jgi:hypothetical protein
VSLKNISANQIVLWCTLLLGLFAAVVIGSAVGGSDLRMVAGLTALMPIAVVLVKLKTNIWVLLPVGWFLTGRLPWLPLPLTVRDLLFMTVICSFTLFFATRVLPWKRKIGLLDYLIYINLAYLVTVYVRNPAGFWALQTNTVGGRPYFEIALVFGAFAILSRVQITDSIAKIFPLFFVIPAWCIGLLDIVARVVPQTAYPLAMMYSGVGGGVEGITGALQQEQRIGETRMTAILWAGWSSVLALCAKYNPITLLSPFYPGRVLLFGLGIVAIFLSGYRSLVLFAMAAFLLSTVLRGKMTDLWIAGAGLFLGFLVLVSAQGSLVQLPLTAQRALSWLPGDWDQEAAADAEGSTRWRVEMWGWAWNDDRIMKDRTWGQGFGLSLDDMSLIAASLMAGQDGGSLLGGSDRENFMITGTFHSGPLSTIKYIGVVGLALYYPLLCYMAVLAWRLCLRARGTKVFSLALFVCIPVIYEAFNFVVVFGALELSYPKTLFWAGLMNMTQNYLDRCALPAGRLKILRPPQHKEIAYA